jgi:hypothetical protein
MEIIALIEETLGLLVITKNLVKSSRKLKDFITGKMALFLRTTKLLDLGKQYLSHLTPFSSNMIKSTGCLS